MELRASSASFASRPAGHQPHQGQTLSSHDPGKIERYHRTLKNVANLENYYLPWHLEHKIGEFVQYYNHQRVHESPDNLTPADVYCSRDRMIKAARNLVKEQTLRRRNRLNMELLPLDEKLIKPAILRQ